MRNAQSSNYLPCLKTASSKVRRWLRMMILSAMLPFPANAQNEVPTISEFMASNDKTLLSASGESYDWIEIHNPGANPVDLGEWYLTDDPAIPTMWRFPENTILNPDDRLVVFASGLGSAGSAGELHTIFKLDASGEYLALVKEDGTIGKAYANYPKQEEDYAYGTPERTTGLIARWKFNETSGTIVRDSVSPPSGLVAGGLAGSFNLIDPNPGDLHENSSGATNGIDPLGPTLGNLNSKPPWQDNSTVVYSGQIYDTDGKMSFRENIDDSAWLRVGQQVLLNDQGWNTMTTQAVDFGSGGWYDFELRMGNGSGGAGAVSSPGFGFDPEGGTNFEFPQNTSAGLGDLFRTRAPLDASVSGESSPTWESGKFGNALWFDGVDDVATHSLPSSVTMAAYTLSLWVKPNGLNQADSVSFFDSGSTGKDFQIGFDGSGQYKLTGDNGSGIFGPAIENWTHLAVVCDGTSRRLYLNGSFVTSVANADNEFQHYRFGVNRNGSLFFKGWLDEARLFDVALSDAQVLDLFENETTASATYLKSPTPGEENDTGFSGFASDTKFSVDRGFFETPFTLAITTETPGATIRFTTDGSTPSETHGTIYTDPVTIASTTIVRAIATKPDYLPTGVDTQSYFFPEDVIRQSADGSTPSGWPATKAINNQKMVYGMDPDIVDGFNTPEEVKEALLAIPTLSIATELDNLFGQSNGIYVNAKSDGRTWERPMSLELIHSDGSEGFQIDAGLRIRGGYSRSANNPKHSFRVFFRSEYGQGNLHYPMFEDEGVEEFDKFDLRTSQNYSWAFGGPANNTMVREVWSRDTQSAMGQPYTRSRYYHLYLNGIYWGIYMTQERVSGTLGESYLGGDKDDFDTVHQDSARQINATSGNLEAYDRLWQRTIDGWTDNDVYFQAQGLEPDGNTVNPAYERLLDVDNLIDYMLVVYYNGDRDGPASRFTTPKVNNYYAIYNRVNPDGWKFPAHDMEHSLGRGENNMVKPLASDHASRDEKRYFTAHFLHEQLTSNQEYVIRFADQFYLRHYNDGLLTEENAKARIAFRVAQIDKGIIAESARWGDTKSGVPKNHTDWVNNVNMVTTWMTGRNAVVLNQLRTTRINASSPYWYPSIDPPDFSQHGGQVGSSFLLTMSDPNVTPVTMYYTLDGSDPRLLGGTVSPAAQVAQPSGMQNTLLLDAGAPATAFVPTDGSQGSAWTLPGFDDSTWQSGSSGVGYDTATTYLSLFGIDVASMRNKNASVYCRVPFTATDISEFTNLTLKVKYDDGFVAYLNGGKVASANASANPAWNATATSSHSDSAAQQYVSFDLTPYLDYLREGANVLAFHGLNISTSSSDMLIVPRLEASKIVGGTEISLPNYLTTVNARSRTASGEWSALHGAIFQVDVVPASIDNLVITEIMYNPAGTGGSEYVEIRNVGPLRIDLTGVVLGGAFDDFTFEPLTLASGESAVVVRDLTGFNTRYTNPSSPYYSPGIVVAGQWPGGKLKNGGETITLIDAKGADIFTFKYDNGGNWPGRADGRGSSLVLPDPSALEGMTLAERNAYLADGDNWNSSTGFHGNPGGAEPGGSEVPPVMISEILAHSDPPLLDAIELHNPGSQPVDVSGWRLTERGSSLEGFRIPNSTIIPPGGFLVFDETDFNPNGLWNSNAGTRGPDEFALSGSRGGDIWLIETDDADNPLAFIDHVEFGASFNGVSFGRWPNGSAGKLYSMQERSLFDESSGDYPPIKQGGPSPGPKSGEVMISEIMYNSIDGNPDLEFIELYNSADSTISLTGWKLDKGVDFAFPPGTLIQPGHSVVVVGFDLNATDKLDAFRTTYGIGPEVVVVGGWSGNLNNGGETISLLRPDLPPLDDPSYTPMVIEEIVTYSNDPPWPAGADGNGSSLIRKERESWSNDPNSWGISPGAPSPGPSPSLNNPPFFIGGNPPATIAAGTLFSHRFTAADPDGNALSFSSPSSLPWLNLVDEANGSAILAGIPPSQAVGSHTVVVETSDGIASPVEKTFVVTVEDKTPPQLTLLGAASIGHEAGTPYLDPGVTAMDEVDGNLLASVTVVNHVDVGNPGAYLVTYSVSDQAGNQAATLSRTVIVDDSQPPVVYLLGASALTHEAGTPFVEPGAYAMDTLDGNLTDIIIGGSVNVNALDAYQLTYDIADAANNTATRLIRTVTVVDTTSPVLTLLGSAEISHDSIEPYIDPGVIASDSLDGNLTAQVVVGGNLDSNNIGTYLVTYDVSDQAGNAAVRITREVNIVNTPPPIITLLGPPIVYLDEGNPYVEPGFTAVDLQDGNLTGIVAIGGDQVDVNHPGAYRITYDVTNSINVGASQATRSVVVRDITPPTLVLIGEANATHEATVPYMDPGALAFDNADGNLTSSILVNGNVDVDIIGVHTLTYSLSDQAGNTAATLTRLVTVQDSAPPVITLNGDADVTHQATTPFVDLGATAFDSFDGDLTESIVIGGDEVNASSLGIYHVFHEATDNAGNLGRGIRTVTVRDTIPPVLSLQGPSSVSLEAGTHFADPGATAMDSLDGDLSGQVLIGGDPLTENITGIYTLTYSVSDLSGNAAQSLTREITVQDTLPPVLELRGDANVTHEVATPFVDPGTTAIDFADGNLSATVTVTGSVDSNKLGDYLLTYTVSDQVGNAATPVVRTVLVRSLASPVITLLGDANVTFDQGTPFVDPGVTAFDAFDGNLTSLVRAEDNLDVNVPGTHHIFYSVINASGLAAEEVFRTIVVNDLNDAPSTNNVETFLSTIPEDVGEGEDNPGDVVSSLIEGITDLDSSDSPGLALVAKDGENGVWQYSLDGGVTFVEVGSISDQAALLLRADDPMTLLRFVPKGEFHDSASITFRAWDQTVGENGDRRLINSVGGRSAFSSDTAPATIIVTPRADAPHFTTSPTIECKVFEPYSYHVVVQEPDDETFILESGALPEWLTFTTYPNGSALLEGVPGLEDVGAHVISLKVTDVSGKYAEQSFAISVTVDQYLLTVNASSGGSSSGGGNYDYGTAVSITASPSIGYHFVNWTGTTVADPTSATTTVTMTAYTTLKANFAANIHELVVNADSGGSVSDDGNHSYGTNAPISATPDAGYYFTGWSGPGVIDVNSSATTVYMTQDRNVTASFALVSDNQYVLQTFADPSASGSTSGGGAYDVNSRISISASTLNGYQFLGWSIFGSTLSSPLSATAATVTLNQDSEATAHFAALDYKLEFSASTGGSSTGEGTYAHGQSVSISATPESGYSFMGWEVGGTVSFAVTAAARQYDGSSSTLYIDGKENPPLSLVRGVVYQFVLDGSTTTNHPFYFSTSSTGGGNFALGEFTTGVTNSRAESGTVSIAVDENTPSMLYYYSGNRSGMGNLITVIDSTGLVDNENAKSTTADATASYALRANFSLNQYMLTVNAERGGSVLSSGIYDHGAEATITALPEADYLFDYWSGAGVVDFTSSSTTVTMDKNRTVTAHFAGHPDSGKLFYELNATENDGSWWESDRFGFFHQVDDNWVYHFDLGWIFVHEVKNGDFWYWHGILGWLWTNSTVYPASWSKETNQWIFFYQNAVTRNLQTNADGHLWYYDYSASQWTLAQDTPETIFHEVEINLSPSIGGTVSGAGSYEEDSIATLTATPSEGYQFTGWSGGQQSSSPTLTFTVTKNSALTAIFEKTSAKQIIKSLFD